MGALACIRLRGLQYEWLLQTPKIEGFKPIDDAIAKISSIMHIDTEISFSPDEFDNHSVGEWSIILGEADENHAKKCYCRCLNQLLRSIRRVVLPSLRVKGPENLFPITRMWWNRYKLMADCLVRLFRPLVSAHPDLTNGLPFESVPMNIFCEMVLDWVWADVSNTVNLMIWQERDGELINPDLLKEIIEFSIEIQEIGNRPYYAKLERAILVDTAIYCSMLSTAWLSCSTFGGYIQKVDHWFQKEEIQKGYYLSRSTIEELLEVARSEFIDKNALEVAELIPSNGRLGLRRL